MNKLGTKLSSTALPAHDNFASFVRGKVASVWARVMLLSGAVGESLSDRDHNHKN